MTREEAIKTIDALYPADCKMYPDIAVIGQDLLERAKTQVGGASLTWRNEPTKILVRYAELCKEQYLKGEPNVI